MKRLTASGGTEVVGHAVVVWEEGGGSANLSTHVANSAHASSRE